MTTTPSELLPPDAPLTEELVQVLLSISLAGILLLRPVYAADGQTIEDLAWVRLNPAAQRMLQLAECPPDSFLTLFPMAEQAGMFDFYRDAFLSGQVARRPNSYLHDGLDGYYSLVAQRYGPLLVVSFTDANEQPRAPTEQTLRDSQAHEQAARAEAEADRHQLQALVDQAPVAIGFFEGPELRITAANELMCTIWGYPAGITRNSPFIEAVPELQGQGFDDQLRQVLTTGVPVVGTETPAQMLRDGRLQTSYYNFIYKPIYDASGRTLGVMDVAMDVTQQVVARQQLEAKEQQTNSLNEELQAANEEILANNTALERTQLLLRQLNDELETRVAQRTRQAQAAQADLLAATRRQVQEREELYQVFEQTPAVVALLRGPEHCFHYRNPAFQGLFPGRPLTGRLYADAMPEIVAAGLMPRLDKVYATGQPYFGVALPVVTMPPDGAAPHLRYYDFSYQPYREDGHIVGVAIFAYDVTEQVHDRQAVEASARQLRLLTDALPVLIGYLDTEERYQFTNEAYRTWFNQDPTALLGRPVREIVGERAYQNIKGYIDRALAGERLDFESQMPYREGMTKYIRTSYVPDFQAGQPRGFYTLVQDITEPVLARQQVQQLNDELLLTNDELRQTNQQLTRTNADLDNFIYTASHDLKQPISNIEGLLRLLEDLLPATTRTEEPVAPVLTQMQDAVERFKRTIAHLTEVSKLQAEFAQPTAAVELAAVVEDVRQDLLPQLTATGARLEVAVADCRPRVFSEKNLRSIVYNLLSNALKYRHPDRPPHVRIRCGPEDGRLVLTVQDNGLGLGQQQQTRLFQLFQRLHTHVEGSGVGLYMVKKMVDNAGGTIAVQSDPTLGTTFTLSFPT